MRDLINLGFLTDYKIYGPRSDVDYSGVSISKTTGDYNPIQADRAVMKSQIVGDVVEHYLKLARGKIGVTFATSIKCCEEITSKFIEAGVPAATVSAKTPEVERAAILTKLANRQLLQVVNVDLFGEGFDLPAIEVVSMARKTLSYSLFCQQFGRALRILRLL
jgi:superfamily II DNA or RNA helicase